MKKTSKSKTKKPFRQMTESEAIKIAASHGLQWEVSQAIKSGCTPAEALREWDLL